MFIYSKNHWPCVWVGNVAEDVKEDEFRHEFEAFGQVDVVRLFRKSKCAFVTFHSSDAAVKSLALEGKQMGSLKLTLNVAKVNQIKLYLCFIII
jgi:RNA recognition motif-containing protein